MATEDTDDAPFLMAQVERIAEGHLNIQIRGSDRPTNCHEDWGRFWVPLTLVPSLAQFFTALAERARVGGLLEPGEPFEALRTVGYLDPATLTSLSSTHEVAA